MTDLTLDDYRRVLKWAGFVEDPSYPTWSHAMGNIREVVLVEPSYKSDDERLAALLLLDNSVLAKVRTMDAEAIERFELRLHNLYQDAYRAAPTEKIEMPSILQLQILYGTPGDITRAALAAGIVTP